MLVVKSQRLLIKLLGVAGRILGTAGTGKPPLDLSTKTHAGRRGLRCLDSNFLTVKAVT